MHRWTCVLVTIACIALAVAAPRPSAFASDPCLYRPWAQTQDAYDGRTYADVMQMGANHRFSVRNNFDYYNGLITPDPPAFTPPWFTNYRFLRETHHVQGEPDRNMIAQWYQKTHATRPAEAVIAIHGNSILPDAWFADSPVSRAFGDNYTDFGGTALYNAGYDVYAPYITHVTRFQVAHRRVAAAHGEQFPQLDVRRVVALFHQVEGQYTKVHIVGVSYGGELAVFAAQALAADPKRGVTVSFEGWYPDQAYVDEDSPALFAWDWEMIFPGVSMPQFLNLPSSTYIATRAVVPCGAPGLSPPDTLLALPQNRIILYPGAHEYWHAAFLDALRRG